MTKNCKNLQLKKLIFLFISKLAKYFFLTSVNIKLSKETKEILNEKTAGSRSGSALKPMRFRTTATLL